MTEKSESLGAEGRSPTTPLEAFEKLRPRSFLTHALHATSQYDEQYRSMAAEILLLRATVERLRAEARKKPWCQICGVELSGFYCDACRIATTQDRENMESLEKVRARIHLLMLDYREGGQIAVADDLLAILDGRLLPETRNRPVAEADAARPSPPPESEDDLHDALVAYRAEIARLKLLVTADEARRENEVVGGEVAHHNRLADAARPSPQKEPDVNCQRCGGVIEDGSCIECGGRVAVDTILGTCEGSSPAFNWQSHQPGEKLMNDTEKIALLKDLETRTTPPEKLDAALGMVARFLREEIERRVSCAETP